MSEAHPIRLGRYVLGQQIAAGGMARVHLGKMHADAGFTPIVAVKRLHSSMASDAAFVQMFLDEARLASRIRHPNVVPVLDVVALSDELFLVMEYVHGESLAQIQRGSVSDGRPLSLAVISAIIKDMLHGLHAAHEARDPTGSHLGIVHRDVSPQNVLVGCDGNARLVDFGIAKATGRMQSTREGELKGKLAYMAPEQLRRQPVTRQADVYSSAVVLWETLTGRRLFVGDNEGAVVEAVLFGDVEPPSTFRPDVSPSLDAVVMRGLMRDPSKRWATAQQMALALLDAVPAAAPHVVGECVNDIAGPTLDVRMASIRKLEAWDAASFASRDHHQVSDITVTEGAATIVERESKNKPFGGLWLPIALSLTLVTLTGVAISQKLHMPATHPPQVSSAPQLNQVPTVQASVEPPVSSITMDVPVGSAHSPSMTARTRPIAHGATTAVMGGAEVQATDSRKGAAQTKQCLLPYRSTDGIKRYRTGSGAECDTP